jgi:hypothetical protein
MFVARPDRANLDVMEASADDADGADAKARRDVVLTPAQFFG